MKLIKFSAIACSALLCLSLSACNDEEENVVPEINHKKAEAAKNDSADIPELQSIQSLSSDAKGTFKTQNSATAPGDEGGYTIQVGIQPSKKGANAILKKLEDQNIKGYISEVENPGELEGTYYRIRVGYFKTLAEAQNFGKSTLEPQGFAWWVDYRSNDSVGTSDSDNSNSYGNSESASTQESTPAAASSYTSTTAEQSSTPAVQAVEESSSEAVSSSAGSSSSTAVETSSLPATETPAATTPVQEETTAAPAPANVPAANDSDYDDWE
ncbi:MAG: SPOR domain-containing protein [Fibrobacteraceae bacterium]|nr:SPOR domain-containing protein [Fibrobacteraceae bacterium]